MKLPYIVILFSFLHSTLPKETTSELHSEQVVIIGAGAAGIAAASKLFENGFTNVTILEAENRIGGRIYTTKMGEYLVDLGAQWVYGEKNNSVYELAWPLGLLDHSNVSGYTENSKLYGSSGGEISINITNAEGDQELNWQDRAYGTILDILMKKYPNPKEELPVLNNTILNTKVVKISYNNSDGLTKVLTKNGIEFPADHVIFTGSLGVLQADYDKLFDPHLPDTNVKAIKNLDMGHVVKILLYFEDPWWTDDVFSKAIYWTEDDKKEMEKNLEKRWQLSIYGVFPVEHKTKLLSVWLTGRYATEVELIPDANLRHQLLEFLVRFIGDEEDITELSMMERSRWNTNENFRGTYSYAGLNSEIANVYPMDLETPILKNNKPVIQFAGEATVFFYGTVHGAIDSGRREANRLIQFYSSRN